MTYNFKLGAATREQWLAAAAALLLAKDVFASEVVPTNIKYSCSWPGGGSRTKRIGECWSPSVSAGGTTEIFISPIMYDTLRVLDILTHEMVHAIVGTEAGHRGAFKRLAVASGLEGKMTATTAGPELVKKLEVVAAELGDYPHSEMTPGSGPTKKQTTRLLKAECDECGYVVRITRKWAVALGACCPAHGTMKITE